MQRRITPKLSIGLRPPNYTLTFSTVYTHAHHSESDGYFGSRDATSALGYDAASIWKRLLGENNNAHDSRSSVSTVFPTGRKS